MGAKIEHVRHKKRYIADSYIFLGRKSLSSSTVRVIGLLSVLASYMNLAAELLQAF